MSKAKGPINLTENVLEATVEVQTQIKDIPFVRLNSIEDEFGPHPELLNTRFWD
jgi:hypothetical protein